MKVLKESELPKFFEEKVIREIPDDKFAGKPYTRLNHSEWLSFIVHSGGMIDSKLTFSIQMFQQKVRKDGIVIFKTSKGYVQKMSMNNGKFYLIHNQKNAPKKTKWTTTLREFRGFFLKYGETLPESIRVTIEQMLFFTSTFGNKISAYSNYVGQYKNMIRRIENLLGIKFDDKKVQELMELTRMSFFSNRVKNFEHLLKNKIMEALPNYFETGVKFISVINYDKPSEMMFSLLDMSVKRIEHYLDQNKFKSAFLIKTVNHPLFNWVRKIFKWTEKYSIDAVMTFVAPEVELPKLAIEAGKIAFNQGISSLAKNTLFKNKINNSNFKIKSVENQFENVLNGKRLSFDSFLNKKFATNTIKKSDSYLSLLIEHTSIKANEGRK